MGILGIVVLGARCARKRYNCFIASLFLFRVVATLPSTDGCVNNLCNLVQPVVLRTVSWWWRRIIRTMEEEEYHNVQKTMTWPVLYRACWEFHHSHVQHEHEVSCYTHTSFPLKILICVSVRFTHHNVKYYFYRQDILTNSAWVDSTSWMSEGRGVHLSVNHATFCTVGAPVWKAKRGKET